MTLPTFAPHFQAKYRLLAGILLMLMLLAAHGQSTDNSDIPRLTSEHVKDPGWWPTKGTAPRSAYAGSAACKTCHRSIAESQAQTPMFKAASRPEDASVLRLNPYMQFKESNFSYALIRQNDRAALQVEDKWAILTAPLLWAMGSGEIGQTYLLKSGDTYYESRISYFQSLAAIDITPGHTNLPATREEAVGIPQNPATARRCFGCHTTASTVAGVFDPENATPGIGCEACHGPSAAHVKAEEQGDDNVPTPFNPETLAPRDSVDFCGACHRTPADVAVNMPGDIGIFGIRYSAYRLERSRCWGSSGDTRITCIACHDPHNPIVADTASYDSKCLRCHANGGHQANTGHQVAANQAPSCTVASKGCVSCHMPRYELKIAHTTMTDHFIRIVRPGSGYPD